LQSLNEALLAVVTNIGRPNEVTTPEIMGEKEDEKNPQNGTG